MAEEQKSKQSDAKAAKAEEVKREAQVAGSAQGTTPPPPPKKEEELPKEVQDERRSAREAASAATEAFAALSNEELTAIRTAVDSALFNKGREPEGVTLSLPDVTATLRSVPRDEHPDDLDSAKAAKAVDVDPKEVIGYAVRQARNADGVGIGPSFVSVVTVDGQKHAAEL